MINGNGVAAAERPKPGPPAGKVSTIAIGITHAGLADAVKNEVIYLIVKDLADEHVKRWADVFIPMQIGDEDQGKALERGAELEASSAIYGINPQQCQVIGRTTVAGAGSTMLYLIIDASGRMFDRSEGSS